MNYEDFIRPRENETENIHETDSDVQSSATPVEGDVQSEADSIQSTEGDSISETLPTEVELDVQKIVVEQLASEKVSMTDEIEKLRDENSRQKSEVDKVLKEKDDLLAVITDLKTKVKELGLQLEQLGDQLLKNVESPKSNQVTLLERNPDIDDKFEGETRDHVIEALRSMQQQAEKEGRLRCAQLLESVLVSNEPSGMLQKKREELTKLFESNQNVINGQVINELDKLGIPYKHGETYLLTKEILNCVY